jgi:CDGSH-type Zn-finger protein
MKKTKEMLDATHKRHITQHIDHQKLGDEDEPEIAECGCGATGEVNYDDGTERRYYCYSALSMCSP